MNYIVLIILLLLGFSLLECLASHYPKAQENIFHLAFLTTWILVTIKYYYGPDIWAYVTFFERIPSDFIGVWHNPSRYWYEPGFQRFCSLIKACGGDFWVMTAIVSCLYFFGLWQIWKYIPRWKTVALMLLYVIDYNLFMTETRQCLSVAFFLLMVWQLLEKEKYKNFPQQFGHWILVFLFAYLCTCFHKSGMFAVSITLFFYAIHTMKVEPVVYHIFMIVLCLMLILPMTPIMSTLLNVIPIPANLQHSISIHMSLGKNIQIIWAVYAMIIVCIEYYSHYLKEKPRKSLEIISIVTILFILLFYQFYYMLNRLRSPFLPILIAFMFYVACSSDLMDALKIKMPRLLLQLSIIFIFLYSGYTLHSVQKSQAILEHDVTSICTVFELRHKSAKKIRDERMETARLWWQYDYSKVVKGANATDI